MNEEVNPHISEELKKKWCNYEFQGKPFKLSDGNTYMRAHSHAFEKTHFYCFETDWFWHSREEIPLPKKVEKDLIRLLTKY